MTTTLLEAGRKVLNHLNERIDNAARWEVPVFDGIAELHTAVHAAEAAGGKPLWLCIAANVPPGMPAQIRAWTDNPDRARQLADNGLQMVPYYAQPEALRGALAGLVDAICTDAGNGGLNISARTASLVADATALLGGFHGRPIIASDYLVPDGWKLVPVDPTDGQLEAANAATLATETLLDDARFACERAGYKAALDCAPPPPGAGRNIKVG